MNTLLLLLLLFLELVGSGDVDVIIGGSSSHSNRWWWVQSCQVDTPVLIPMTKFPLQVVISIVDRIRCVNNNNTSVDYQMQ